MNIETTISQINLAKAKYNAAINNSGIINESSAILYNDYINKLNSFINYVGAAKYAAFYKNLLD